LDDLGAPFTKNEIDAIVLNLPSKKSPGSDGFNSNFIKKCWRIIAPDFYELCFGFYENLCPRSINGSYIVLILKIDNSSVVSDYRTISLLNSSIKLLTKILGNKLQSMILRLVLQNQYGFIKNRSIQDYLTWTFEYLQLCHKSKELIIVKLDIEKVFDKIEHEVILQVWRHK
jgi:hypothetical protein